MCFVKASDEHWKTHSVMRTRKLIKQVRDKALENIKAGLCSITIPEINIVFSPQDNMNISWRNVESNIGIFKEFNTTTNLRHSHAQKPGRMWRFNKAQNIARATIHWFSK